jgi:NAD(P)-dependent dehydrogenase (short-subunit alcohol dehydrogenase family)
LVFASDKHCSRKIERIFEMTKTILIAGYGPGVSMAIAEKFGSEGFQVALVARSAERLAVGVKALESKGIKAAAFPADLSDVEAIKAMVSDVRKTFGAITVLEWTATQSGTQAGDMITADMETLRSLFDISVLGLMAAIQAVLPDLRKAKDPAILITNGGAGYVSPAMDKMMVNSGRMGLAVANAAKHKLVGMLAHRLKADGIYVGEVMVTGLVKTPGDTRRQAKIDPIMVSDAYWKMYTERKKLRVRITGIPGLMFLMNMKHFFESFGKGRS